MFAPDKRLLQIVVKMKDIPRAYASVLELLGSHVNLIETVTYTVDDRAIFSGFAEALFPNESTAEIEKVIFESAMVLECEVIEGSNGVLVDTFHKGLETSSGEPLVLFRRRGLVQMFDEIMRVSGSAGEGMLYNVGVAMGISDGSEILRTWKPGFMAQGFETLLSLFSAFGWGVATSNDRSDQWNLKIRMDDCFECSSETRDGHGCEFVKGFLVGSAKTLLVREIKCEELICRFKGGDHCEFHIEAPPAALPAPAPPAQLSA